MISASAWRLRLVAGPAPDPLPQVAWSCLTIGWRQGFDALDALVAGGVPVGPVMVCPVHGLVHLPVAAACADAGSVLGLGPLRRGVAACPPDGYGYAACPGRIWALPAAAVSPGARGLAGGLTDLRLFHDQVRRTAAAWRRAA